MIELRRSSDFVNVLSVLLVVGAFLGAFLVLLDIRLTLTFGAQIVQIGSSFAAETKGMVLQSMLITALTAVVGFWFGTTKQGQDQAQSVSKIAESSTTDTAKAVAAARSEPLPPQPPVPAVTPAPINPETGVTPAVEVAKKDAP